MAGDARINQSDLHYIVQNLQQPPPPPQPPAQPPPQPPHYAAADRERPELDGLAQECEQQIRRDMMAQRNAANLAAQSGAIPAQEIIWEFHHTTQPI